MVYLLILPHDILQLKEKMFLLFKWTVKYTVRHEHNAMNGFFYDHHFNLDLFSMVNTEWVIMLKSYLCVIVEQTNQVKCNLNLQCLQVSFG